MDASFNFDRLFGNPSGIKFEDKQIFKTAALMFEFDPEKEFSGFDEADIKLLKNKACLANNGKYILPEDLSARIISDEIGFKNIVNEIENNKIQSEFTETLLKAFKSKKIDFKAYSDSELFYLTRIAGLFPDKLNLELIRGELQRRYYFSPFQRITEKFAGRRKELEKIYDYVDWLPKKNLVSKTIGFIRNTINWHEKPPMLIQGIGGIGKSALISKFIVENNIEKGGKSLPFVYIDFDLPGFSLTEPLGILLESLRQLSIQFSQHQEIFSAISRTVSNMIYQGNHSEREFLQSSNQSLRGLVYNSVENLIRQYSWGLDKINEPVLIVFDSFEEMQYRASRKEMNNFFSFIREISEKIPRIRPVFVGRAEIRESVHDIQFDIIELTEFDNESATILLNNYGISDISICHQIFSNFGGNPLLLLLAADLLNKNEAAVGDFKQINEKKHEYLVNRILEQIHDPEVRKIAVPGMLLRRISPEVIRSVLAVPCKLGKISISAARKIYDDLIKEAALISKTLDGGEIVFRQDLRMACEEMIREKYPEESVLIRQKAIAYYKKKKSESDIFEAEYYFHVMKSGIVPDALTGKVYKRIRTKLESSLIELPPNAQLHIKSLMGSQVADSIIDQSTVNEWENYYLSQIKKGLNSELGFLQQLYEEVSKKTERSENPASAFPIFEALLYQRLNKLDESNRVVDHALANLKEHKIKDDSISSALRFIKAQNLEYRDEYIKALSYLEFNFSKTGRGQITNMNIKSEFLKKRLHGRLNMADIKLKSTPGNFKAHLEDEFVDTHWNYIFKHPGKYLFQNSREFNTIYKKNLKTIAGLQELDRYCWKSLGVFLKDIALTGEFEIVLKDFLYIVELNEKLETFDKEIFFK